MSRGESKPLPGKKQKTRSAGVIPVFLPSSQPPQVLLLRCFGYWDFPKGVVHPGEAPLETALRELEEETTLRHVSFDWGTDSIETPVYAQGKVARYYLGRVDSQEVSLPISPALGRPEHHGFRWVTFEDACTLLIPRLQVVLAWARERISSVPE